MKKLLLFRATLACLLSVLIISCQKKEDAPLEGGDYCLSLRTDGAEGTSDYVLLQRSLTDGEVSAEGRGIEQLGWCYYASAGNTVLSFNYGNASNKCIAYHKVNGQLKEKGSLLFSRVDCIGKADNSTLVGIGAPWGGGTLLTDLQLIDANIVGITATKQSPLYMISPTDTLNKWPTGIIVRDGKVFVGFYPLGGKSWKTPLTDTAYVSIFTYPGLEYITTIKDARTGPIGFYGNPECMITTETGDIYTLSPNATCAGYTQSTRNSGVLKIRKGSTSFDKDYFFDVQAASGGHYKILSGTYVGNDKVVARVAVDEQNTPDWEWAALDVEKSVCKLVILDLVSQTVTDVSGVPMHGGQFAVHPLVENGKLYISIGSASAKECAIYEVDPLTATGKKGALVKGLEVPAIFRLADE